MNCKCFEETDKRLEEGGTRLKNYSALMIGEGKMKRRYYWPEEKINGKPAKGGVLLQFCPFCGKGVDE